MKFFKSFTGQLILGGVIAVLAVFSFSISLFTSINDISTVDADIIKTMGKIPSTLFTIQSLFLHETNLLFSLHHNLISSDSFLAQLEEIDKQEKMELEKIRTLQKQFENIVFLNEEEEVFSGEFKRVLDAINITHGSIEEKLAEIATVHEAKNETQEEEIRNEILKMETELGDKMSLLDSTINILLDKRNQYIEDTAMGILKDSFFFMSFIFIIVVGLNTHLIIQTTFSLRTILKGIEASKRGSLAYHITLHAENEFGAIAKSFNQATDIVREKETALRKTVEEMEKQARELAEKNDYLERFRKVTVGRELKMIELKKEIEDLKKKND